MGVWPEPDTCVKETRFNGARAVGDAPSPSTRGWCRGRCWGRCWSWPSRCSPWAPSRPPRPEPAEKATRPNLTVVDLNLLHGVFCPTGTNMCAAPDRVELLARDLEEAKCPEVVGLQEVSRPLYDLIKKRSKTLCDGKYQVVFGPPKGIDTELVLTTLPVTGQKVEKLVGQLPDRVAGRRSSPTSGPCRSSSPTRRAIRRPACRHRARNHCPPVCPTDDTGVRVPDRRRGQAGRRQGRTRGRCAS